MPEQKVKVRVKAPWRVVDPEGGKPYSDGQELAVSEKLAGEWIRAGLVERATASKEK